MLAEHRIPRLDGRGWQAVPALALRQVHPQSAAFRPQVAVQIAHDGAALHLRWELLDRYVRSVVTTANGDVHTDSCVECFIGPVGGRGYCNVEVNAGGIVHASHIEDPRRINGVVAKRSFFQPAELAQITTHSSLPPVIPQELTEEVHWTMAVTIPFRVLAARLGQPPGSSWRGNFYHCADHSSHPRWISWADIGERLDFHQPERFGQLMLGD